MKRLTLSIILTLAAFAANATYCPDGTRIESHPNNDCNYKPPATPAPTTSKSKAPADAKAQADAKAAADARAEQRQAQLQGQQQGQKTTTKVKNTAEGGDASSSSNSALSGIGNDSSSSSFKAIAISLPTTSPLPQLPLIEGCPNASVKQHDREIGWNFIRDAQSEVNTDRCTGIKWYNTFVLSCRFASAYALANLEVQTLHPKFAPPPVKAGLYEDLDISMQDCEVLRAPKVPTPAVVPATNYIYVEPACPAAPKPKTKVKRKVPAKVVDICKK